MIKGKRIVVTGGAGFIGSNLARALARDNEVVVLDDLSTGHLENIQDFVDDGTLQFVEGSVTDLDLLHRTCNGVDVVFHEAAIPSVPRSVKDPLKTSFTNVNGTLNALLAAKDNGVTKVVYASSSSVYGDTPMLPKQEDMAPCPLSPYAVSKLAGEYYCQVFTEVYGLQTVSLRYFNVYGPRQDPRGDYAAVIPRFIQRVLDDKSPVVYGDGEQTRDFTFIDDVVNANIVAAEHESTGVFNIAGGTRVSINELAQAILKISGKQLELTYDAPRPGDVRHSLADISKAEQELGFKPQVDLIKGLEGTIEWFQKQSLKCKL